VQVLATLALFVGSGWFLVLFAQDARQQSPGVETHWGGFGGGLGGIRVSPSLLYLVVGLVLGAAAVMLVQRTPGAGTSAPTQEAGGRARTPTPAARPPSEQ
jgi:hypothetical protein